MTTQFTGASTHTHTHIHTHTIHHTDTTHTPHHNTHTHTPYTTHALTNKHTHTPYTTHTPHTQPIHHTHTHTPHSHTHKQTYTHTIHHTHTHTQHLVRETPVRGRAAAAAPPGCRVKTTSSLPVVCCGFPVQFTLLVVSVHGCGSVWNEISRQIHAKSFWSNFENFRLIKFRFCLTTLIDMIASELKL